MIATLEAAEHALVKRNIPSPHVHVVHHHQYRLRMTAPSSFARMLLLPTAVLALSLGHVLATPLLEARDNTTTVAAPISFTPDENWDGIDGSWSSFTLRVGTPAQFVRTFVSFAVYQTWVVLPQGCFAAADQGACAMDRGWTFDNSTSTTFEMIGIYDLWTERNLGYVSNAQYGYDVVGLGGVGEEGPTLTNTTVGAMAVEDFYLGVFGLNPKPTNFTSFNEGSPSYMTQLRDQKYIPSVSAGYTAGASYKYTGVLASLTLGGYDTSKFIANDVEWTFSPDNERDLVVALQSVSTPSRDASSPTGTELLPNPIYIFIDSTVPQIWLPVAACQLFEQEFGLVYDNTTDLYLVNSTLHSDLLSRNANVTFVLGEGLTNGSSVSIVMPYAAFDLTAQTPYQGLSNSSTYFPLRRAANDTQYTLGRAFLQEAYLSVDWERQRFNVSQVDWTQNAQQHLVAIPAYDGQETYAGTGPIAHKKSGIGAGAIAGIVVGAIAAITVIALFIFFLRRRSRQHRKAALAAAAADAENEKLNSSGRSSDIPSPITSSAQTHTTHQEETVPGGIFIKAELEGSSPAPADTGSNRVLSSHGSTGDPFTPGGSTLLSSYFGRPESSSAQSPSTPGAGEGTYSSSHTNRSSVMSPVSEADSKERRVYEMPGDMPTIKEKDGRGLSEKEAMGYRERIYNGVQVTPEVNEGMLREARRVEAENVVEVSPGATTTAGAEQESGAEGPREARLGGRHRAFSFEGNRGEDELYE